MNNKKRPAVSNTTLTRRYSRRISANNNVEQIASLDACVDDIILSIASYLTSCELLNFALTCKRFGARSTVSADDDNERQDTYANTIMSRGSRAFARPSTTGDTVVHCQQDGRADTFQECRIITHSHITQTYRVEFQNQKLKSNGNNIQLIHREELASIKYMTKKVGESLRLCVKRDGDTISISDYIMVDSERWGIESSFVEEVGSGMLERVNSQLESRVWSLMEESALLKALSLLPKDGCLMWREGESWMGVCHQFEKELDQLAEEDSELEKEGDAIDLDQFLDRASELSRYFESELAQILSRSTTATRFFQRYSSTLSNYPLKECHMRGVSSMVGVYENGLTGVLIDNGNGRRIQSVLFLACLRSEDIAGPFIIVAPLYLVPAWVETFKLYTDMSVACLVGTQEEREAMYSGRLKISNVSRPISL